MGGGRIKGLMKCSDFFGMPGMCMLIFSVSYEYCKDEDPKTFYGVPVIGNYFERKTWFL